MGVSALERERPRFQFSLAALVGGVTVMCVVLAAICAAVRIVADISGKMDAAISASIVEKAPEIEEQLLREFVRQWPQADLERAQQELLCDHWMRQLTSSDPQERRAAAIALGEFGPDSDAVVVALLDAASDADQRVKMSAEGSLTLILQRNPCCMELVACVAIDEEDDRSRPAQSILDRLHLDRQVQ
jgi:uncharacterized membrane protein